MLKNFSIIALSFLFLSSYAVNAATPVQINRLKADLGERIVDQIESDPALIELFNNIYSGKVTPENIIDAMKEYEHSRTASSRFDDYLSGNKNALTAEEKHGYELFKSYGCAACHNGVNLGGTQFKQLGVARNYIIERKTLLTPADLGLAEVTKKTKDFYVFKVPSLRNVAISYPYYHDGSVKSLDEAVSLMGKYQLGVEIPEKDVKTIVIFLKSLTAKSLESQETNNIPVANHF